MIDIFDRERPRMVAEIRKALDRKSPAALQTAAHTLQGALRNFGASPAWQAALKLEELGRVGNLNGAQESFAKLEESLTSLKLAFETPGGGGNS